jgi:hypothetical protein
VEIRHNHFKPEKYLNPPYHLYCKKNDITIIFLQKPSPQIILKPTLQNILRVCLEKLPIIRSLSYRVIDITRLLRRTGRSIQLHQS